MNSTISPLDITHTDDITDELNIDDRNFISQFSSFISSLNSNNEFHEVSIHSDAHFDLTRKDQVIRAQDLMQAFAKFDIHVIHHRVFNEPFWHLADKSPLEFENFFWNLHSVHQFIINGDSIYNGIPGFINLDEVIFRAFNFLCLFLPVFVRYQHVSGFSWNFPFNSTIINQFISSGLIFYANSHKIIPPPSSPPDLYVVKSVIHIHTLHDFKLFNFKFSHSVSCFERLSSIRVPHHIFKFVYIPFNLHRIRLFNSRRLH